MEDLTCQALVELVTAYLDDALSLSDRERFVAHLRSCPHCDAHLEQMRFTIAALGRLPADALMPAAEHDLLDAFRGWKTV